MRWVSCKSRCWLAAVSSARWAGCAPDSLCSFLAQEMLRTCGFNFRVLEMRSEDRGLQLGEL